MSLKKSPCVSLCTSQSRWLVARQGYSSPALGRKIERGKDFRHMRRLFIGVKLKTEDRASLSDGKLSCLNQNGRQKMTSDHTSPVWRLCTTGNVAPQNITMLSERRMTVSHITKAWGESKKTFSRSNSRCTFSQLYSGTAKSIRRWFS